MNLNGTLAAGYNAAYGNYIGSSHNLSLGGAGTLSGFYYNPNFVSFNVSPYYNQSRANSNSQSIFDSSGVNFSSGIFSGSHFPGSISYTKSYNSQGNFAVPGVADFTTHGNSNTFAINWSEILPDMPSLSVGFQKGSSEYSILGTNSTGDSDGRAFHLNSGYRLEGFNLGAFYSNSTSESRLPAIFGDLSLAQTSHSSGDGYGFSTSHALPLHGQWSASFNRSDINSDYLGYKYSGTVNTISTTASAQPTNKLHIQMSTNYSDNLTGVLYQAASSSGGAIILPAQNQSASHAADLQGSVSYAILPNLQTQVFADRRTQYFLGETFGANAFGGGISYTRDLLGGSFNTALTLSDNTVDNSHLNTLGLNASAGYSHPFRGWMLSGSFNYAQNAQTLLISYTSSYYSYSGNVRRHLGPNVSWSLSAGGSRTGLSAQPGTESSSQSYSTGLSYSHWIGSSANFSKSSGQALPFGGGLGQVPLAPVVPSNLLILYGGQSYSFSLSTSPIRGFTASAGYGKARSNTVDSGLASWNNNDQWNTLVQYQFRKMYFTGGYSKLLQGFSASGIPPANVSSFYVGVSRWFNFF